MADSTNLNSNFITDFIDEDLANGVNTRVQTRFPPEPNGYLHIGHAKAICIDFSIAEKYGGVCNLRLDDTNPSKEDVEYVDAIKEDIEWLGYKWNEVYYASSYFDFLYECAIKLIKEGKASCDQGAGAAAYDVLRRGVDAPASPENNLWELAVEADRARATLDKPTCIIARTLAGKGAPSLEGVLGHTMKLPPEMAERALAELQETAA
mgnify:CR=1 FL=1